ncbi:MAG: pyruvoyl-dependent arginine decarboxylase [Candidatus Woesearchaeota archaeon]
MKTTTKINSIKSNEILIGCRIPKDFFITKGKGESDITIHAGSYHLALKEAGIEMCNIMTYSSILPKIANEINKPAKLIHGSVMETILAVSNCKKGERATSGIIFGWLYDKKTNEKYGGLVCEYNGSLSEEEAGKQLNESLKELYFNGFSEDFEIKGTKLILKSFIPKKEFGTALVAMCFTNYVVPIK